MSKKKVLDYDPKTGFGNFAEIMNKNNALDMARNGVNMPANNMAGAPLESGTLGGTQAQSGMLKVDTATPPLVEAAGATEDPVATDTETGTVTGTDASTGADTGAVSGVTSDLTGTMAQPILSVHGYKSDFGTYAEWMAKNGYDPDRDYDEKKAALEYDYETSMATYGRRAEELSQMGLSNSGLSDIYQLGAFNSYLQQQNQIANERIAAKKKYKQEYNTLYQQNQDALKLDNANAYNFGLSLYDGENIDFVHQQLTQQGYDAGVVEQAVQSLAALDVNSLPTVQKKLNQDTLDIDNAVNTLIQSGYVDGWNEEKKTKLENLYRAKDWSEEKIQRLIDQLNGYASVFAPSNEDYVSAGMAAFKAENPNFVYDGKEMSKAAIKQALKGTEYEEYDDDIIARFDADKKDMATAAITDAVNKETGTFTIDELETAWSNAKDAYADDANSLNINNDKISKKTKDLIEWALEGKDGEPVRLGSAEVAKALGFDASEWENLNDSQREREILNLAGELKVSGQLTSLAYNSILSDYVTSETKLIIDKDQDNAEATGLQEAGALVYNLKEMKDSGYMTDEEYLARTREVINNMKFKQPGPMSQITWNSKVEGAEATVVAIPYIDGFVKVNAKDASDAVDAYKNGAKTMHTWDYGYDLFAYNGKLYACDDGYLHGEVEPKNIFVQGDGVTNSDKQQAGVYEILVAMLTPLQSDHKARQREQNR